MSARLNLRFSLLLLVVSGLPLLIGLSSAWNVHQAHRNVSEALAWNVTSIRAGEELAIGVRDIRTHLNEYLITGDPRHLEEVPLLRRNTDRWLVEARRTAVTPREQELIDLFTQGYEGFFLELGRLALEPPPRRPALVRELIDRSNHILRPAQEYLDFNEGEIQHNTHENQELADRMVVGLLLLGGCGTGAGLLAGYGLARTVSHSLVRLSVPVRDAAGKLSEVVGPVTVSAGLGLEELEAVLCRMAGQIGAVVERLQQSQRETLRAEQLAAVGQMAAGIAHELRNPLMCMKILVQSAADRGLPASLAGRDLGVLEEEINRLEHLTSTFLDYARPPRPQKHPLTLQNLLEDTADLVASQAAQRDVRIVCDLPPEPVPVEADAGQLRQVVFNLLLNALEAVQENGVVDLELEPSTGEGGWHTIRVNDSGPGLPPDLGEDIFEPFVSTKPTGIGLGLSISRRIIEEHGGLISAADRPEGGAVFTVRLPLGSQESGVRGQESGISEDCRADSAFADHDS